MAIIRAANHVEEYAARARGAGHLSGRVPQLDAQVHAAVLEVVPKSGVLVDVGCGDGGLLAIAPHELRIGISPTEDEVRWLRSKHPRTQFFRGFSTSIPLPDITADVTVCNGVVIALGSKDELARTLAELARVTKAGGTVYVGEIAESEEHGMKRDSLRAYINTAVQRYGLKGGIAALRDIAFAALGRSDLLLYPDTWLYCRAREEVMDMAARSGLQLIAVRQTPRAQQRYDCVFRR